VSDIQEASQLIAFGLRPRMLPREDQAYNELVLRYRTEDAFKEIVEEVAGGMGLQVLDVTSAAGAVVVAQQDSIFAVHLTDYSVHGSRTVEGRVIHGLIQLATAALCFPRPPDLDDPEYVARVNAEDIDEYVRELSRRLDAELADTQLDPPAAERDLARAWRAYCNRPSTPSTRDGRAHQTSTQQWATKALEWLAEQGCMRKISDDRGGTYQATDRYRVLLRDFATSDLYVELNAHDTDIREAVGETV
jgi:hypothetical protein